MKYICIITFACFFCSCSPLIQKAYIIEPPDYCNLDSARDKRISIAGQFFTNTNVHFAHAVTDKFGYFAKAHIGYQGWYDRKDFSQIFPERNDLMISRGAGGGLFYFHEIPNGNKFELLAGFGYQSNDSRLFGRMVTLPYVQSPMMFNQDANCLFYKAFVQPNFIYPGKKSLTCLAVRCELLYADSYDYAYRFSRAESNSITRYIDDHVSFSHKYALSVSPFLIRQINANEGFWYWYFGLNLHSRMSDRSANVNTSTSYLGRRIIDNHPASAVFTFGVALTFSLFK